MGIKKPLQSFKELNVNFIFSKRIKTSFSHFCLFKINNTYQLYMSTLNCNIISLSWKENWYNDYHTVCPFTTNKQTIDIIDFFSE